MTSFLTFCLPLKAGITETEIKDCAREWIGNSIWYHFTETEFPEDDQGTLIESTDQEKVWFRHLDYQSDSASYLSFRLERHDDFNRKWYADAVFALGEKKSTAYVSLDCRILNRELPADFSDLPGKYRYPRILKVLKKNGLLGQDGQLICGQAHEVSEKELKPLKEILAENRVLHIPLLYFYLPEEERLKEGYQQFLYTYFPNISHVYYAYTPEQDRMWRELLQDCGIGGKNSAATGLPAFRAELIFPQLHLHRTIPFFFSPDMVTSSLLDLVADSVMEYMVLGQEILPEDCPSWESIHYKKLYDQTHQMEEPYQIHMNQAMAERMYAARRQHRLTQGELAKMVGASSLLLSRLERLETIKTKRALIHDIEKALGLEYNELARLETKKSSGGSSNSSKTDKSGFTGETSSFTGASSIGASSAEVPVPAPKIYHFCYHCGAKLAVGSRFCQNCGQKL